jgi:hypothetical protein
MKMVIVAFAVVAASAPAFAQDAASKPTTFDGVCFDVVPTTGNAAPFGPILVNRCTGATWLLAREPVSDAKGKTTNNFSFAWSPLEIERSPAILGFPETSVTYSPNKEPKKTQTQ